MINSMSSSKSCDLSRANCSSDTFRVVVPAAPSPGSSAARGALGAWRLPASTPPSISAESWSSLSLRSDRIWASLVWKFRFKTSSAPDW